VCGLSIGGIADSNPAECMVVRPTCLLFVVQVAASANSRLLVRRSPTGCGFVFVCLCVSNCGSFRNLNNVTAKARVGFLHHKKK
jgi:hypothetical protein